MSVDVDRWVVVGEDPFELWVEWWSGDVMVGRVALTPQVAGELRVMLEGVVNVQRAAVGVEPVESGVWEPVVPWTRGWRFGVVIGVGVLFVAVLVAGLVPLAG